jgi:hypothetical protein
LTPPRLILIDKADRLRVSSLEQLRDLFDRGETGLVLIGMSGMEKRLARYPQLYSRVGFVQAFRTLRAGDSPSARRTLGSSRHRSASGGHRGSRRDRGDHPHQWGKFRLIHRLLSQVERILRVNSLSAVTPAVVDAAREGLVIGAS